MIHVPVMLEEVLNALNIKKTGIYVDATVGLGGHAEGILKSAPDCTLIGIDRDDEAVAIASERLGHYKNVYFARNNFSHIKEIVNGLDFKKVNGILLDLGISVLHIKSEGRGFSFLRDEPLDMRMDRRRKLTAGKIINTYPEKELADLIWKFGEERNSRRIARAIVYARRRKSIQSCKELSLIIEKAAGRRGRIHPATRTFQALRIKVNNELDELSAAVTEGADMLEKEGRFCILSYHSLEDRIIKNAFKRLARDGIFHIITKKPLMPGRQEKIQNPSSRSAKLRVAERI